MLGQPVLHSRAQPTNQMPLRNGLLCVLSPFIPRRPFWASAGERDRQDGHRDTQAGEKGAPLMGTMQRCEEVRENFPHSPPTPHTPCGGHGLPSGTGGGWGKQDPEKRGLATRKKR